MSTEFVLRGKAMYRTLLATCGSEKIVTNSCSNNSRCHTLQATCGTLHFNDEHLSSYLELLKSNYFRSENFNNFFDYRHSKIIW